MLQKSNKILDRKAIERKVKRIAFQVLENNFKEESLFIVGIQGGGSIIGKEIQKELESISDLRPKFIELSIEKAKPENSEVSLSENIEVNENTSIILVDDVLNSGRTVFYAMQAFLKLPIKKIETAFLVNRSHRLFPVAANYTGVELATTMLEHINFSWEKSDFGVYLE